MNRDNFSPALAGVLSYYALWKDFALERFTERIVVIALSLAIYYGILFVARRLRIQWVSPNKETPKRPWPTGFNVNPPPPDGPRPTPPAPPPKSSRDGGGGA